jgi:hypothetical protein
MFVVTCTQCGFVLNEAMFNQPDWSPCPSCAAPLRVEVFPTLFTPSVPAQPAQSLVAEGEAGCFYHPNKKAVLPCEICGRFLCALCDVELNGQHLCPSCLATGQKKGKLSNLDNRRVLYDSLALTLALTPFTVILWPFSLITAPATLFIAVRYWRAPGSVVERTKIRLILALVLALAQIVGWGIGFWVMFKS